MPFRKVWGFEVSTDPHGRNIWPSGLKAEAVRRIQENGASPSGIARDLGTRDALVRKWEKSARPTEGMTVPNPVPFAPLNVSPPNDGPTSAPLRSASPNCAGRLELNDMTLEFPIDIDGRLLASIVAAMRWTA